MSSSTSKTPVITPCQTMRGHTNWVTGVVYLPSGRRIITCSVDGSLRLWDLESSAQIGEDWRDENEAGIQSMALSPNAKTVATGSGDRKVRLWDIETRKVIAKWTGHTNLVWSLCWSADGKRVASGSWDGTTRVWDVKSGETDDKKIATGGNHEERVKSAVKIWDSKTGKLITTLNHDRIVYSLAWTSDGKKLISGSYGPIRIFDTATWQQIAVLDGGLYTDNVNALSLSPNNRLLASVSREKKVRLWNLDTNLQIGPPLQHEDGLRSAALSADGKVLVTSTSVCLNENLYAWDIHAILKEAGLEDLLLPISHVPVRKLLMTSSASHGTHHRSSTHDPRRAASSSNAHALLERFSTLFRHSHSKTDGATELQQRPRRNILFHRGPRIVDVPTVQDRKALAVAPRPRPQQQSQSHGQGSSLQPQPTVASTSTTPAPGTSTTASGTAIAQSPPIPLWARFVLFLCCASPPHANGH